MLLSITEKIISILQQGSRFTISAENCVVQASDGASVMSANICLLVVMSDVFTQLGALSDVSF